VLDKEEYTVPGKCVCSCVCRKADERMQLKEKEKVNDKTTQHQCGLSYILPLCSVCSPTGTIHRPRIGDSRSLTAEQRVGWFVRHVGGGVAEVLPGVHRESTCALPEAVALRPELASVALLAERVLFVDGERHTVECLVAQTASKAQRVPFPATSELLLSREHRLVAARAFFALSRSERHFGERSEGETK